MCNLHCLINKRRLIMLSLIISILSLIISVLSSTITFYYNHKNYKLNEENNRLNEENNKLNKENKRLNEENQILNTLSSNLTLREAKPHRSKITFIPDDDENFSKEVETPVFHAENGLIANAYFFFKNRDNSIGSMTVEQSDEKNNKQAREHKVNTHYGLSELTVHDHLAFFILLCKGFNHDIESYIVTYKFTKNYEKCRMVIIQPNMLISSTSYKGLSKNDINIIKEFYSGVFKQLKEINFIN